MRGLLSSGSACFVRGHSSISFRMTEKEMALEAVRELPDDCSLDEIADRIEFMAAVQKGLDQLDRGEGIPHDEIRKQLASWLPN
jgi:predicted transcriptional regulator